MLAVIPARGGSQEVKRKNLAIVQGKPLLLHIAGTLRELDHQVVISTDDAEIRSVAEAHGYQTVIRDEELADATVVEVAEHAIAELLYEGPVIVAQPTCPFVSADSIEKLVALLEDHDAATLITPNTHILRSNRPKGRLSDMNFRITEGVNRQQQEGVWQEVGIRAYQPGHVRTEPTGTVEVSGVEAWDVDSWADLEGLRSQAESKSILFRVTANNLVGSGHLRRCLLLANELQNHDISFHLVDSNEWAKSVVENAGWPTGFVVTDLIINDTLDTTLADMLEMKQWAPHVVTLEDRGSGTRHADLTVNALYPQRSVRELAGPKYADLRPEFIGLPDYQIRDSQNVLVMFGGTDPAQLGDRIKALFPNALLVPSGGNVPVAHLMREADLLITSAGRTVYEAAAVGVPAVVMAQNQRETTHAHLGQGNVYLGLGKLVDEYTIRSAVNVLLEDPGMRADLSQTARATVDGLGVQRIVHRIRGLLAGL